MPAALDMELRPSVARFPFDAAGFEWLVAQLRSGELERASGHLSTAPMPLRVAPKALAELPEGDQAELRGMGAEAIARGQAAALVLNGGMATRFGGVPKGVVPTLEGRTNTSFLAIKLAQLRRDGRALGGHIPVVLMHSFATQEASDAHLAEIGWSDLPPFDRDAFTQSVMPRVLPNGTALHDLPEANELPAVQSGALDRLRARGVQHVLVSNVDNLGATLDPLVLGAHLHAVQAGSMVSVEVVRRMQGDAGGCVALHPGTGKPVIIEGFRLPPGVDLSAYPHFNTNTLWLHIDAFEQPHALTWFAVHKRIEWPAPRAHHGELAVVQFEQLIGQITETVPTAYLEVPRSARFVPIKTREDLVTMRTELRAFAAAVGLVD